MGCNARGVDRKRSMVCCLGSRSRLAFLRGDAWRLRRSRARFIRHTYRSWLDAAGTPIAVQQKLMRHADIRTTLNMYGDVVTNEMAQAHSKVVRMAMPRAS